MDPNTAMEAATEGAKALTKFQEIIEKLFGPKWTRKQADANAYADEKKLETIRNNPDMEIIYVGDKMHARERTPEALAHRAEQRTLAESIRQEDNLEKVLDVAANEMSQMKNVSDEPVDEDWLIRLFHIAKDVSSEDMQFVWGKILAGEIEKPGRFSYRTLECVRNLSQREAQLFQKVLPFSRRSSSGAIIPYNSELLKSYGIRYIDILNLDEIGLLQFKTGLTLNCDVREKPAVVFNDDYIMVVFSTDGKVHKFSMPIITFSSSGNELANILKSEVNKEYLIDFLRDLQKTPTCQNIKIRLNQIVVEPPSTLKCVDLLEQNI